MREIIELFTDPETSAEELLINKSAKTIKKGILFIAQLALLTGLLGSIAIKSVLPSLLQGLLERNVPFLGSLRYLEDMNFGLIAITIAIAAAILIVSVLLLKALIMAGLLVIIRHLFKGQATFIELFHITLFSQVIFAAIIFAGAAGLVVINGAALTAIAEIGFGIIMLFQYWYLVFIIIGFNAANRVGFIKSILAVFLMQSIIWGLQYAVAGGFMLF